MVVFTCLTTEGHSGDQCVFSLSGVRQGGRRGSSSPGQTVTEAEGSLRPRRWLHLCVCGRAGLPLPAAPAVADA